MQVMVEVLTGMRVGLAVFGLTAVSTIARTRMAVVLLILRMGGSVTVIVN